MDRVTDEQRAQELGMTLEKFQSLIGFDPLDDYPEFTEIKSQESPTGVNPLADSDKSKD